MWRIPSFSKRHYWNMKTIWPEEGESGVSRRLVQLVQEVLPAAPNPFLRWKTGWHLCGRYACHFLDHHWFQNMCFDAPQQSSCFGSWEFKAGISLVLNHLNQHRHFLHGLQIHFLLNIFQNECNKIHMFGHGQPCHKTIWRRRVRRRGVLTAAQRPPAHSVGGGESEDAGLRHQRRQRSDQGGRSTKKPLVVFLVPPLFGAEKNTLFFLLGNKHRKYSDTCVYI